MAAWGSCDFHELRDLNERIKAAASEPEMDAFYTGLLDEMMNGLQTDVKELTPVDRGHLRRNWFITKAKRSGKVYRKPASNKTYTASAPGEPPALRTGDISSGTRRSWRPATGRRSDGTFRPSASGW